MKIVTVTGTGANGELQPYHIVNPANVIINTGEVVQQGTLKDGQNHPIPIKTTKSFVHVGGQPLLVEETIEELYELFRAG